LSRPCYIGWAPQSDTSSLNKNFYSGFHRFPAPLSYLPTPKTFSALPDHFRLCCASIWTAGTLISHLFSCFGPGGPHLNLVICFFFGGSLFSWPVPAFFSSFVFSIYLKTLALVIYRSGVVLLGNSKQPLFWERPFPSPVVLFIVCPTSPLGFPPWFSHRGPLPFPAFYSFFLSFFKFFLLGDSQLLPFTPLSGLRGLVGCLFLFGDCVLGPCLGS